MMEYLNALSQFCIEFKPLDEISYSGKTSIFLGATACTSFLVVFLDILTYIIFKMSFLNMHYDSKKRVFLILVFWTLASTIVSYFGLILDLYNTTMQSCLIIGVSWLYIIIKIVIQINKPPIIQK